jgi:hypothetical protein
MGKVTYNPGASSHTTKAQVQDLKANLQAGKSQTVSIAGQQRTINPQGRASGSNRSKGSQGLTDPSTGPIRNASASPQGGGFLKGLGGQLMNTLLPMLLQGFGKK